MFTQRVLKIPDSVTFFFFLLTLPAKKNNEVPNSALQNGNFVSLNRQTLQVDIRESPSPGLWQNESVQV